MVCAVEAEREDIHKVPGRRGVADLECVISQTQREVNRRSKRPERVETLKVGPSVIS
jgi:hypothetical protein